MAALMSSAVLAPAAAGTAAAASAAAALPSAAAALPSAAGVAPAGFLTSSPACPTAVASSPLPRSRHVVLLQQEPKKQQQQTQQPRSEEQQTNREQEERQRQSDHDPEHDVASSSTAASTASPQRSAEGLPISLCPADRSLLLLWEQLTGIPASYSASLLVSAATATRPSRHCCNFFFKTQQQLDASVTLLPPSPSSRSTVATLPSAEERFRLAAATPAEDPAAVLDIIPIESLREKKRVSLPQSPLQSSNQLLNAEARLPSCGKGHLASGGGTAELSLFAAVASSVAAPPLPDEGLTAATEALEAVHATIQKTADSIAAHPAGTEAAAVSSCASSLLSPLQTAVSNNTQTDVFNNSQTAVSRISEESPQQQQKRAEQQKCRPRQRTSALSEGCCAEALQLLLQLLCSQHCCCCCMPSARHVGKTQWLALQQLAAASKEAQQQQPSLNQRRRLLSSKKQKKQQDTVAEFLQAADEPHKLSRLYTEQQKHRLQLCSQEQQQQHSNGQQQHDPRQRQQHGPRQQQPQHDPREQQHDPREQQREPREQQQQQPFDQQLHESPLEEEKRTVFCSKRAMKRAQRRQVARAAKAAARAAAPREYPSADVGYSQQPREHRAANKNCSKRSSPVAACSPAFALTVVEQHLDSTFWLQQKRQQQAAQTDKEKIERKEQQRSVTMLQDNAYELQEGLRGFGNCPATARPAEAAAGGLFQEAAAGEELRVVDVSLKQRLCEDEIYLKWPQLQALLPRGFSLLEGSPSSMLVQEGQQGRQQQQADVQLLYPHRLEDTTAIETRQQEEENQKQQRQQDGAIRVQPGVHREQQRLKQSRVKLQQPSHSLQREKKEGLLQLLPSETASYQHQLACPSGLSRGRRPRRNSITGSCSSACTNSRRSCSSIIEGSSTAARNRSAKDDLRVARGRSSSSSSAGGDHCDSHNEDAQSVSPDTAGGVAAAAEKFEQVLLRRGFPKFFDLCLPLLAAFLTKETAVTQQQPGFAAAAAGDDACAFAVTRATARATPLVAAASSESPDTALPSGSVTGADAAAAGSPSTAAAAPSPSAAAAAPSPSAAAAFSSPSAAAAAARAEVSELPLSHASGTTFSAVAAAASKQLAARLRVAFALLDAHRQRSTSGCCCWHHNSEEENVVGRSSTGEKSSSDGGSSDGGSDFEVLSTASSARDRPEETPATETRAAASGLCPADTTAVATNDSDNTPTLTLTIPPTIPPNRCIVHSSSSALPSDVGGINAATVAANHDAAADRLAAANVFAAAVASADKESERRDETAAYGNEDDVSGRRCDSSAAAAAAVDVVVGAAANSFTAEKLASTVAAAEGDRYVSTAAAPAEREKKSLLHASHVLLSEGSTGTSAACPDVFLSNEKRTGTPIDVLEMPCSCCNSSSGCVCSSSGCVCSSSGSVWSRSGCVCSSSSRVCACSSKGRSTPCSGVTGSCCCAVEVYAIEKLNGENAQISFSPALNAWCVCSKHVCALLPALPASPSTACAVSSERPAPPAAASSIGVSAACGLSGDAAAETAGGAVADRRSCSHVCSSSTTTTTATTTVSSSRSSVSQTCGAQGDSSTSPAMSDNDCQKTEEESCAALQEEAAKPRFKYAAKIRRVWMKMLRERTPEQIEALKAYLSHHTVVGELVACSDKQHFVRYTRRPPVAAEKGCLQQQQQQRTQGNDTIQQGGPSEQEQLSAKQQQQWQSMSTGVHAASNMSAAAVLSEPRTPSLFSCPSCAFCLSPAAPGAATVPAAATSTAPAPATAAASTPAASAVAPAASAVAPAAAPTAGPAAAEGGEKLIFFGIVPHSGLQLCLCPRVAFAVLKAFMLPAARVLRRLRASSPQQLLLQLHEYTKEIFCSDVDETGEGVVLTFTAPLLPLLTEGSSAAASPAAASTSVATPHGPSDASCPSWKAAAAAGACCMRPQQPRRVRPAALPELPSAAHILPLQEVLDSPSSLQHQQAPQPSVCCCSAKSLSSEGPLRSSAVTLEHWIFSPAAATAVLGTAKVKSLGYLLRRKMREKLRLLLLSDELFNCLLRVSILRTHQQQQHVEKQCCRLQEEQPETGSSFEEKNARGSVPTVALSSKGVENSVTHFRCTDTPQGAGHAAGATAASSVIARKVQETTARPLTTMSPGAVVPAATAPPAAVSRDSWRQQALHADCQVPRGCTRPPEVGSAAVAGEATSAASFAAVSWIASAVQLWVNSFLRAAASLLVTEAPSGFHRASQVLREYAATAANDDAALRSFSSLSAAEQSTHPAADVSPCDPLLGAIFSSISNAERGNSIRRHMVPENDGLGNSNVAAACSSSSRRSRSSTRKSGKSSIDEKSKRFRESNSLLRGIHGFGTAAAAAAAAVEMKVEDSGVQQGSALNRVSCKEASTVTLVLRLAHMFRCLLLYACSLAAEAAAAAAAVGGPAAAADDGDVRQSCVKERKHLKQALEMLARFVDLRFLDFSEDAVAFAAAHTDRRRPAAWELPTLRRACQACRSFFSDRERGRAAKKNFGAATQAPEAQFSSVKELEQEVVSQARFWWRERKQHTRQDKQQLEEKQEEGLLQQQQFSTVMPSGLITRAPTGLHWKETLEQTWCASDRAAGETIAGGAAAGDSTRAAPLKTVCRSRVTGASSRLDTADAPAAQGYSARPLQRGSRNEAAACFERKKRLCLVAPPFTVPVDLFDTLTAACDARGVRLVLRHQLPRRASTSSSSSCCEKQRMPNSSCSGVRTGAEATLFTTQQIDPPPLSSSSSSSFPSSSSSSSSTSSPPWSSSSVGCLCEEGGCVREAPERQLASPDGLLPQQLRSSGEGALNGSSCCCYFPSQTHESAGERQLQQQLEEESEERPEQQQQQQSDVADMIVVWGYGGSSAAESRRREAANVRTPDTRDLLSLSLKNFQQLLHAQAMEESSHREQQRHTSQREQCTWKQPQQFHLQEGDPQQQQQQSHSFSSQQSTSACAGDKAACRRYSKKAHNATSNRTAATPLEVSSSIRCLYRRGRCERVGGDSAEGEYRHHRRPQELLADMFGGDLNAWSSSIASRLAAAAVTYCSFRVEDNLFSGSSDTPCSRHLLLQTHSCSSLREETFMMRQCGVINPFYPFGSVTSGSCESSSSSSMIASTDAHAFSRKKKRSLQSAESVTIRELWRQQQEEESQPRTNDSSNVLQEEVKGNELAAAGQHAGANKRLKTAVKEEVCGAAEKKQQQQESCSMERDCLNLCSFERSSLEQQLSSRKEEESLERLQQQLKNLTVTIDTLTFLAAAAASCSRGDTAKEANHPTAIDIDSLQAGAFEVLSGWAAATVASAEAYTAEQQQQQLMQGNATEQQQQQLMEGNATEQQQQQLMKRMSDRSAVAVDAPLEKSSLVAAPPPCPPARLDTTRPRDHKAQSDVSEAAAAAAECAAAQWRAQAETLSCFPRVIFVDSAFPRMISSRVVALHAFPHSLPRAASRCPAEERSYPTVAVESCRVSSADAAGASAAFLRFPAAAVDSGQEESEQGAAAAAAKRRVGCRRRRCSKDSNAWTTLTEEEEEEDCKKWETRRETVHSRCHKESKDEGAAKSLVGGAIKEEGDMCVLAGFRSRIQREKVFFTEAALQKMIQLAAENEGVAQFVKALDCLAPADSTEQPSHSGSLSKEKICRSRDSSEQQGQCVVSAEEEQQPRQRFDSVTSWKQQQQQQGIEESHTTTPTAQSRQAAGMMKKTESSSTRTASRAGERGTGGKEERKEMKSNQQQCESHEARSTATPAVSSVLLVTCLLPMGFPGCGKTTALMHLVNKAVANSLRNRSRTKKDKDHSEQPHGGCQSQKDTNSSGRRERKFEQAHRLFNPQQQQQLAQQQQQISQQQYSAAPRLWGRRHFNHMCDFCVSDSPEENGCGNGSKEEKIGLVIWNASRPRDASASSHMDAARVGVDEGCFRARQQQGGQRQQQHVSRMQGDEQQQQRRGEQQVQGGGGERTRGFESREKERLGFFGRKDRDNGCEQDESDCNVLGATGGDIQQKKDKEFPKTRRICGDYSCLVEHPTEGRTDMSLEGVQSMPREKHGRDGSSSSTVEEDKRLPTDTLNPFSKRSRYHPDNCDILFYVSSDEATGTALRRRGYAAPSGLSFQHAISRLLDNGEGLHRRTLWGGAVDQTSKTAQRTDQGCMDTQESIGIRNVPDDSGDISFEIGDPHVENVAARRPEGDNSDGHTGAGTLAQRGGSSGASGFGGTVAGAAVRVLPERHTANEAVFREAAREGARDVISSVEAFFSALTENLLQWQSRRAEASSQHSLQQHAACHVRGLVESGRFCEGTDPWSSEKTAVAGGTKESMRQRPLLRVCVLIDKNHPVEALPKQALFLQRQIEQLNAAMQRAAIPQPLVEGGLTSSIPSLCSNRREEDSSSSGRHPSATAFCGSNVTTADAAVGGTAKLQQKPSGRSMVVIGAVCVLTLPPDALVDGTLQPKFCLPAAVGRHSLLRECWGYPEAWPVPWSSATLCRCLRRVLLRTDHPTLQLSRVFCDSRRPRNTAVNDQVMWPGSVDTAVGGGGRRAEEGLLPNREQRTTEVEAEICRSVNVYLSFIALYRNRSLLPKDLLKVPGVDRILPLHSVWRPAGGSLTQQQRRRQYVIAEAGSEHVGCRLRGETLQTDAAAAAFSDVQTHGGVSWPKSSACMLYTRAQPQAPEAGHGLRRSEESSSVLRTADGEELQDEQETQNQEKGPRGCVKLEGQCQIENMQRVCKSQKSEEEAEATGPVTVIEGVSLKESTSSESFLLGAIQPHVLSDTAKSSVYSLHPALECRYLLQAALKYIHPFAENVQNHRLYLRLAELVLHASQAVGAASSTTALHAAAAVLRDSGQCSTCKSAETYAVPRFRTEDEEADEGLPSIPEDTEREIERLLNTVYAELTCYKFYQSEQYRPHTKQGQRSRDEFHRRDERVEQQTSRSKQQPNKQRYQKQLERSQCSCQGAQQSSQRPRHEPGKEEAQARETNRHAKYTRENVVLSCRSVQESAGGGAQSYAEDLQRPLSCRKRRSCDDSFTEGAIDTGPCAASQQTAGSCDGETQDGGAADRTSARSSNEKVPCLYVKADLLLHSRTGNEVLQQAKSPGEIQGVPVTSATGTTSFAFLPSPQILQTTSLENTDTVSQSQLTFPSENITAKCSLGGGGTTALSQESRRIECPPLPTRDTFFESIREGGEWRSAPEQLRQLMQQQFAVSRSQYRGRENVVGVPSTSLDVGDNFCALLNIQLPIYYSIDVDSFGEHLRSLVVTGLKHLSEEASTLQMRYTGERFSTRLTQLFPVKKLHVTTAFLGGGRVISTMQSLRNIEEHINALLKKRMERESENEREKFQAAAAFSEGTATCVREYSVLTPVRTAPGECNIRTTEETPTPQSAQRQLLFTLAACRRFVGQKYGVQVTHFLYLEEGLVTAAVHPLDSLFVLKSPTGSTAHEQKRQGSSATSAGARTRSCPPSKMYHHSAGDGDATRGRDVSCTAPGASVDKASWRTDSCGPPCSASNDVLRSIYSRDTKAASTGAPVALQAPPYEKGTQVLPTWEPMRLKTDVTRLSGILPVTGGVYPHITLYLAPDVKAQFSNPALTSVVAAARKGIRDGRLIPVPDLPYRTPEFQIEATLPDEVRSGCVRFQSETVPSQRHKMYDENGAKSPRGDSLSDEIHDEPLGEYGRWIYFKNLSLGRSAAQRIHALLWCLPNDAIVRTGGYLVER